MAEITSFLDAIGKAENGSLDLVGLITATEGLIQAGERELALTLYRYWLLANPEHPLRHLAAFNCGSQALQLSDFAGAKKYLGKAIEASPDFYQARLNLATAHERTGQNDVAVTELQGIVNRLGEVSQSNIGHKTQALKNLARLNRGRASEAVLRQAIEIDPTQREMVQHWVNRRQSACVWPSVEPVGVLSENEVLQRMAPLSIACYADDPHFQLAVARAYSQQMVGAGVGPGVVGAWPQPENHVASKIRVGYLSSDFCNHAVGYLMSDVFENHDRNRFEITVFNIGPTTEDPLQAKIKSQVDHWLEMRGVPDKQAAIAISARGIDILVDMNGHTNYQRTGLLALRPAPVIANWLGFPGTMGSDYHNYIIADDFIIPEGYEVYYSEAVMRLPCYQPNGKLYPVPPVAATRAELGLPEGGVVYCCFNGSVKITEPIFSLWMTVLQQVPASVLWLRGSPQDDFAGKLREEAARRGVMPDRLVFLPFRSNTEYLGCHRYADVFLDTFPYGAHTTASDALRMGVPIVTLTGLSFASRVCGSLSSAAGLPDLVCDTPERYVHLAVALGRDKAMLATIKHKLAQSLPSCTLFDAPKLVRALEGLFNEMWSAYCAGRLPRPSTDLDADCCHVINEINKTKRIMSHREYQRRLEMSLAYRGV